jgi:hypothetical protein
MSGDMSTPKLRGANEFRGGTPGAGEIGPFGLIVTTAGNTCFAALRKLAERLSASF